LQPDKAKSIGDTLDERKHIAYTGARRLPGKRVVTIALPMPMFALAQWAICLIADSPEKTAMLTMEEPNIQQQKYIRRS
jgi:hypothetical protein